MQMADKSPPFPNCHLPLLRALWSAASAEKNALLPLGCATLSFPKKEFQHCCYSILMFICSSLCYIFSQIIAFVHRSEEKSSFAFSWSWRYNCTFVNKKVSKSENKKLKDSPGHKPEQHSVLVSEFHLAGLHASQNVLHLFKVNLCRMHFKSYYISLAKTVRVVKALIMPQICTNWSPFSLVVCRVHKGHFIPRICRRDFKNNCQSAFI